MGPTFKMSLLVVAAAGLILLLGQLALRQSQETLMRTIEERAGSRAIDLMDEVDRLVELRIREWQAYVDADLVQQALMRSNRNFASLPDRLSILAERESAWRQQAAAGGSELSREIRANRLSQELERQRVAINEDADTEIFGSVLITNRYGVNVADTEGASDYRQDDEDWWQMATQDDVYVDALEFEEDTGRRSAAICLRIEGEDGKLLGVLRTELNLSPVLEILDAAARTESFAGLPNIVMLDSEYQVIHRSGDGAAPISSGLHFVEGAVLDPSKMLVSLERVDPRDGRHWLSAYVRSRGHLGTEGLGWIMLIEYDADQILAATAGLREGILHSALGVAFAFILFSVPIAISFIRENQRRQKLEQGLRNSSQARSDFVVTASRELRAPMTAIGQAIRELEESPLDEKQSRSLEGLRLHARAMSLILGDVLDLSRFEADRSPVVIEPFDLRACLAEVHPIGVALAAQKGLTLELELPLDLPDRLRGDAGLIRQIYLQLLGNAIQFTESGSVNVRVRLDFSNSSEPWLDIWVTDTGVGIPRSDLGTIFEPETELRAGSLVSVDRGRVGDGLVVVKQWLESLGGEIHIESGCDVGSTFYVRIPVDHVEGAEDFIEDGPMQIAERIGSVEGVRVLVVEDHIAVRRVLLRVLDKLGCDTEFCVNGADAVERIRDGEFDIVLLDCIMPVMDGFEAARKIRELPLDYYLPLIAITAHPTQSDRKKCLAAGIDEVISKPVGLVQLCELVAHWAGKNHDHTLRSTDHPTDRSKRLASESSDQRDSDDPKR